MFKDSDFRVLILLILLVIAACVIRVAPYPAVKVAPLVPARVIGNNLFLLDNDAFWAVYSTDLKAAVCVRYSLLPAGKSRWLSLFKEKRYFLDSRFRKDQQPTKDSELSLEPLAPPELLGAAFGAAAAARCYLATNMTLRATSEIQTVWNDSLRIEKCLCDAGAARIDVLCGPVFDEPPQAAADGAAIPKAYFKVISVPSTGEIHAFIFPQEPTSGRAVDYAVSIEKAEAAAKFNFKDFQSPLPLRQ